MPQNSNFVIYTHLKPVGPSRPSSVQFTRTRIGINNTAADVEQARSFQVPTTIRCCNTKYRRKEDQTGNYQTKETNIDTEEKKMVFDSFFSGRFNFFPQILCLLILLITVTPSFAEEPTAYEVLKSFNFPIGILPKGVTGYDLESSTGKFSAYFNSSCSFSLEGSYQLKYEPTIKGYITKGKLSSLEGVSVKLFFMWVDIVEVSRHGDTLDFSVGITGADFPVVNFEECPQCGCGLNCYGENIRKIRTNLLVSSS